MLVREHNDLLPASCRHEPLQLVSLGLDRNPLRLVDEAVQKHERFRSRHIAAYAELSVRIPLHDPFDQRFRNESLLAFARAGQISICRSHRTAELLILEELGFLKRIEQNLRHIFPGHITLKIAVAAFVQKIQVARHIDIGLGPISRHSGFEVEIPVILLQDRAILFRERSKKGGAPASLLIGMKVTERQN
ncbi:hypothetical protein D3C71_1566680 [compost metagenome]